MSVERITPPVAKEKMDEGVPLVDVRSQAEYSAGHPAGAFNIPLMDRNDFGQMEPNAAFVEVFQKHFTPDQTVIVSCQAGGRSMRAAEMLHAAGYTQVIDMRGGWGGERSPMGGFAVAGWDAEGLPRESGGDGERSYPKLQG